MKTATGKAHRKTSDQRFGPFIRRLRKSLHPAMTIEAFAAKVGIRGPYLTKIELGRVPPPSEGVIAAIAEALMTDPELLKSLAGYGSGDDQDTQQRVDRGRGTLEEDFPLWIRDLLGEISLAKKLRYWGYLCLEMSDQIDRGELELNENSVTRESILTLASFCGLPPFSHIRSEAARRVQNEGSI